MASSVTIQPGMSLWWVTSANSREEGEVQVISIDGKRASLSNGVLLNLDTLNAVADPVPRGRCYTSREEYKSSLRLIHEWADFVTDVRAAAIPTQLTVADIGAIRQLLGIGENKRNR